MVSKLPSSQLHKTNHDAAKLRYPSDWPGSTLALEVRPARDQWQFVPILCAACAAIGAQCAGQPSVRTRLFYGNYSVVNGLCFVPTSAGQTGQRDKRDRRDTGQNEFQQAGSGETWVVIWLGNLRGTSGTSGTGGTGGTRDKLCRATE